MAAHAYEFHFVSDAFAMSAAILRLVGWNTAAGGITAFLRAGHWGLLLFALRADQGLPNLDAEISIEGDHSFPIPCPLVPWPWFPYS